MQYKTKAAEEAYKEIISHTGRVVAELETEAFKQSDAGVKASMMLQAKRLSVDGLCQAISTSYQIEIQAVGMVAHFTGQNGH